MKRKLFALLLFCISIFAIGTITVSAEIYGDLEYEIDESEYYGKVVYITGCNTDVTSVVIPDTINGYPVKLIDSWAFRGCYSLSQVTLPDSLEGIEYRAFINCSSLESIEIPAEVTYIGASVFQGCSNLSGITVDEGNKYFCSENGVLYDKSKSRLFIYPPKKSDSTFVLPESVTEIDNFAFELCPNLSEINVEGENPNYTSEEGILFDKDKREIICYPAKKTNTEYVIPATVEHICEKAFSDCMALESITIPDNVAYIGEGAFASCENLENINITENPLLIGYSAFADTAFANKEESWTDNAFYVGKHLVEYEYDYDEGLTSYTVKSGTKSIAADVFAYTELTEIIVPDSVEIIGEYAFSSSDTLKNVSLGNGVTYIDDFAFSDCYGLETISLPEKLEYIGIFAFANCTGLKEITIPGNLEIINDYAFLECDSLESVTIEEGVKEIGYEAFAACASLSSVSLPDSLESIHYGAFYSCENLAEINVLGTLDYIGYDAFYDTAYYWNEENIINGIMYIGKHMIYTMEYTEQMAIAPGTVTIASGAFDTNYEEVSIIVPNSVRNICEGAFEECILTDAVFLGSESEWNEIIIDDYNEALTDVIRFSDSDSPEDLVLGNILYYNYFDEYEEIYYNEFYVPVHSVYIPDFTDGIVIFALYSDDGALVDIAAEEIDIATRGSSVEFDSIGDATKVKVMLWSNTSGAIPLCHAKSAIISDIQEDI